MTEPEVREKFAAELVGDQEEIWKKFKLYMCTKALEVNHDGKRNYYPCDVDSFVEWVRFGKVPELD